MGAISKRSIDGWYDRLVPGSRLTCLKNEVWSPERAAERLYGRVFEYVSGKNTIRLREVGGTIPDEVFWLNRPKRVADVVALSDVEITYVIRDGLTSTWRIVTISEPTR